MRAMTIPAIHVVVPAVLFCSAIAFSLPLRAGGYMRSGGETYSSVGFKLDFADRYFDKEGQRTNGDCSSGITLPVYVDHGWSYYTNVFVSSALRFKDCPGQQGTSLSDTEIGIRRRIDPLSDELVWEALLILPTSRVGATRASDASVLGYDLGVHTRWRPDPYRLDLDRDPLAANWDFGTGLRGWASHLPLEWWAYASYSRALGETNWALDQRGWSFSAKLDWRQSIARTHAVRPAVDIHDDFHILGLTVGFSYPLRQFENFSITLHQSLLGENRDDTSGITVSYGKTFR